MTLARRSLDVATRPKESTWPSAVESVRECLTASLLTSKKYATSCLTPLRGVDICSLSFDSQDIWVLQTLPHCHSAFLGIRLSLEPCRSPCPAPIPVGSANCIYPQNFPASHRITTMRSSATSFPSQFPSCASPPLPFLTTSPCSLLSFPRPCPASHPLRHRALQALESSRGPLRLSDFVSKVGT